MQHAPEGWKEKNGVQTDKANSLKDDVDNLSSAYSSKAGKSAWARLIAKVYKIDPLVCPRCGTEMKILAVITNSV